MPLFIFLLDNNTSSLQLRLTGGSDKEGTIEILYYGVWGYVCRQPGDVFSLNSANVACRRVGFPGAVSVPARTWTSYSSTTPFWLRDVQCFGNETGLEQCSHLGFNNYTHCGRLDVVGVLCIGMHVRIYVRMFSL